MKKSIMLLATAALMFLLSWVYMIVVEFARGFLTIDYVASAAVAVPVFVVSLLGPALANVGKDIKNDSEENFIGLGILVGGLAFVYGNWVFLIHHICGEWLWGPLELIKGARMVADMHEVRVLFNWTGGGLVFAYWVEALVLIFGPLIAFATSLPSASSEENKKEVAPSKEESTGTKAVVMLVAAMGLFLSGCSSDEPTYMLPDSEAVAEWANNQNWEQYENGKTFLVKNLNGTTYIGIGIAEVPKNEKLIKLNQMRTKALAIKVLFNEVEEEIEDPSVVAVIYDEDVDVKGVKKQITVVATATSRTAVPNATGVTEEDVASIDGASLRKWAKEQDWSKYAIGGTAITTNLNGEVVIGVGMVDATGHQLDKMKARMNACAAISKELNSEKLVGCVTVYSAEVKVGDSKKVLVALAKKK